MREDTIVEQDTAKEIIHEDVKQLEERTDAPSCER